jgi:hypothetical protein
MPTRPKIDATTKLAVRIAWSWFPGIGLETIGDLMNVSTGTVHRLVAGLDSIHRRGQLLSTLYALWRIDSKVGSRNSGGGFALAHMAAVNLISERAITFRDRYAPPRLVA